MKLEVSVRNFTPSSARRRVLQLSLVASPLLGAYFFAHTGASSPFACPFRALTGIPCPTCGMTRSFVAIAGGDLGAASDYHLFGPLLFIGAAVFSVHSAIELSTQRHLRIPSLARLLRQKRWKIALLLALLGYHALRLHGLAQTGELAVNFQQSPLAQWLMSS